METPLSYERRLLLVRRAMKESSFNTAVPREARDPSVRRRREAAPEQQPPVVGGLS